MSDRKPLLSESELPLPGREFRRYTLVWSAISLGSYVIAIMLTFWNAWGSFTWREGLVVILILVQIGLYVYPVFLNRKGYLTRKDLGIYFIGSILIWLIELWLMPQYFWLGFMYMGQMFGMLPFFPAFLGAASISLVIFFVIYRPEIEMGNLGNVLGALAGWGLVLVMLMYINTLIRTSRERGKLIKELQEAQEELRIAKEQEAELAVLRERERLARDLHDSLGHTLVSLSVQLEAVQRLYRVDPASASAQVEELKALTRSSMGELRRSIAGLRSPGLGDRALRAALQSLCVDFGERTNIRTSFRLDDCLENLRPALAETIWRAVQEALTNVEKHAAARSVEVELECKPDLVRLHVVDDGIGIGQGVEDIPNHFGLRGMRERVEGLGGCLVVLDTGTGTRVQVELPVITEALTATIDGG